MPFTPTFDPPAKDTGHDLAGARHEIEKLVETLEGLSVLSHKINNPLTALLGRAQLLKAQPIADEKVARAAEVMSEAGQRLAELIRELAHTVKEARQEASHWLEDADGPSRTP